jgi:class 3 adenylate cyclase/TolB-like protein
MKKHEPSFAGASVFMEQKTNTQLRTSQKHKLSAIMFTDMTGFSRKMGESERLTLKLLGDHNRIIRFLVRKHHGKIIKSTGDGFLLDFDSAVEAVLCALEAQERFQRYNLNKPEHEQIWVRIGINLGEVRIVDSDLFGDEVNIAARIQTLAEPGGICISRDVYDHVKNKLSIVAMNLGPKELKNIRQKIEIYKVLVRALGQEAIEIPSVAAAPASLPKASNKNAVHSAPNPLRNFLSHVTPFKKSQVAAGEALPARSLQAEAATRPNPSKNRRRARLFLKALPVMAFSLILPLCLINFQPQSNGFSASWAGMTQWISNSARKTTNFAQTRKTITVLYFENRTKDPRDNWMSVGLADMLITDLERNTSLRILGRTVLMDILKKLGKENTQSMDMALARAVAEQAQADVMLLGSFAREGNTLRIDAQLYDVRRGEMLLAEKAQGESVFGMIDDLSRQLEEKLLSVVHAM